MTKVQSQMYSSLTLPKANIKRILCASTLTPESSEALYYALLLARSYNAKLFCFHAVEPTTDTDSHQETYSEIENRFTEAMAGYLTTIDEPILDWEILVRQGDVANQIIETAMLNEIDLIVMLSRRRPLGAALIGSTAEIVCKSVPCSVLVIHPQETAWTNEETGKIELSRVLVGCDFSNHSKLALSYALEFANSFGSEIDLLQVIPKDAKDTWEPAYGKPVHQCMTKLRDLLPESAASYKINRFIAEGEPYKEILTYAEERNVDLICIGAHSKESNLNYLLGSLTDKILRAAHCPILVTRS